MLGFNAVYAYASYACYSTSRLGFALRQTV